MPEPLTNVVPFETAVPSPAAFSPIGARGLSASPSRVFIIDDDEAIVALVGSIAERVGCAPVPVTSLARLNEVMDDIDPADVVVLDLNLGAFDGVSVLRRFQQHSCKSPILVVSGCEQRVRASAVQFGRQLGLDMLSPIAKPFDPAAMADTFRRHASARAAITVADVEHAIENDELTVHMQPIVDIKTRRASGAEALVRWQHPVRGMIYPDKFIPLVERHPLMLPLTLTVAHQAFATAAGLPDSFSVAINVPPICLGDAEFPDLLMSIATKHRISSARITVEITETAAMADPTFTAVQVTRLRIKGFEVSLDDFGTGYASLTELHRMPVSVIKVDRSFVSRLLRDEEAKAIARMTVHLGRSLGLKVVAEGVEDRETLELLGSWGCDEAQGYHIARPMPAEALAGWLGAWKENQPAHTFG